MEADADACCRAPARQGTVGRLRLPLASSRSMKWDQAVLVENKAIRGKSAGTEDGKRRGRG